MRRNGIGKLGIFASKGTVLSINMSLCIIIKLEGLVDFQKVCNFIQGLTFEIQKPVLSKDRQILEEAIKHAHVYANPSEENDNNKSSHKNNHPYNSNMNKPNTQKTCKSNNDTATQGKKTKATS